MILYEMKLRCFVYATVTTLAPLQLLKYAIAAATTNKTRHSVRGEITSLTIGLLRVGTRTASQQQQQQSASISPLIISRSTSMLCVQ